MSRLAALRRLNTSSTESLGRDLGRLVAVIDDELNALAALRVFEWNNVSILRQGTVKAAFGELVRMDLAPGAPAPHIELPRAKQENIGARVGVCANAVSPTGVVVLHPAGQQKINYATGAATLGTTLGIRDVVWTGLSWEVRL
jgi:hypothetical protein